LQPNAFANEVYNHKFQSSTRQADFATQKELRLEGPISEFQSSTRQADFATALAQVGATTFNCFNPLRGRQTLQHPHLRDGRVGVQRFNPLRGRQTLQLFWLGAPWRTSTLFQSSTRQADFAT